ncbi:MAG: NCS2 family permease [Halobacteriovoraceae bacterium]|nr:NCS2 family permease [Halobacteriovoraceae bacterium]
MIEKIESYFKLKEYNSDLKTEFLGGVSSFLATFYIIIVNPLILSQAGLPVEASITATILIASFSTILMGVYGNNPIVLAPGMGLNAFFAFSIVLGMNVAWQTALGIVFWAGIIFILLSVFKVRELIVEAIPDCLKSSIAVGIGFFITLIGLINSGIIVKNDATLVQMAHLKIHHLIFFLGLIVTAFLALKKIKGHLIFGIVFTFVLSIPIGRFYGDASALTGGDPTLIEWKGLWGAPNFSLMFQLDIFHSLKLSFIPALTSIVITDLFDTLSTLIGVSHAGNLLDKDGRPRNLSRSLLVDAIATTGSAIVGTSPTTSYIESAAGIKEGAKTGLSSVISGMFFLPFLFFSPLLSMFPSFTTAPILVLVGLFMTAPLKKIQWDQLDEALPSFLTIIMIPFTFSISKGLAFGFLSYVLLKFLQGKSREVSWMLCLITGLMVFTFGFLD